MRPRTPKRLRFRGLVHRFETGVKSTALPTKDYSFWDQNPCRVGRNDAMAEEEADEEADEDDDFVVETDEYLATAICDA